MSNSLSKAEILRGKDSFLHVFQNGSSIDAVHIRGIFSIVAGKSPGGAIRVGFAIKRGLLNGVQRNRLRRLMRESYRMNKDILASSPNRRQNNLALVFLYSPKSAANAAKVSFDQIENCVHQPNVFVCVGSAGHLLPLHFFEQIQLVLLGLDGFDHCRQMFRANEHSTIEVGEMVTVLV